MPLQERIQVPERDEIVKKALDGGVPRVLADQLGRAGGESRLAEEILPTVSYVLFNRQRPGMGVEGLANTDQELGRILLDHFPAAVEAIVPEEDQRAEVLELWEGENGQRALLESGHYQHLYDR